MQPDFCGREGFRGGPLLDVCGSLQLLDSGHVRKKEIRLCSGVSWLAESGMVILLGVRGQTVPCRICVAPDSDGLFFWRMHLSSSC